MSAFFLNFSIFLKLSSYVLNIVFCVSFLRSQVSMCGSFWKGRTVNIYLQMGRNEIIISAEKAEHVLGSNIFHLIQNIRALTLIIGKSSEIYSECNELLKTVINNTTPFTDEGRLSLDLPPLDIEVSLTYIVSEYDKFEKHGIKEVHFVNVGSLRAEYQQILSAMASELKNISLEVQKENICLRRKSQDPEMAISGMNTRNTP